MTKQTLFLLAMIAHLSLMSQEADLNSFQITNGVLRGTGHTDSLGTEFNLREIPITFRNDSTLPLQVELEFSSGYSYSENHGEGTYRVVPLPEEWGLEQTSDSLFDLLYQRLPGHINNPFLQRTIQPGEELTIAITTVYPLPAEEWWIVPDELFAFTDKLTHTSCEWLHNEKSTSLTAIRLGMKVRYDGGCTVIPCGRLFFSNP
ncbi:MAG: hypothetical protein HKN32_07295 [Flavobacteriales bacterium]|nr:hypothetical protein [Flavobacteriales bacterium]